MLKPVLFLASIALGSVQAAPVFYTFTGTVAVIHDDKGGYTTAHDIRAGMAVTLVFEVDTARAAYTLDKGVKTEIRDSIDLSHGYRADFFFDSLLTPSLFSSAVTDPASGDFIGFHTAENSGTGIRYEAGIQVLLGDNDKQTHLEITPWNAGETEFLPKLNDSVTVDESYRNRPDFSSSVTISMQCTGISATEPIAIRERVSKQGTQSIARMIGGVLIDPGDRVFLASGRRRQSRRSAFEKR